MLDEVPADYCCSPSPPLFAAVSSNLFQISSTISSTPSPVRRDIPPETVSHLCCDHTATRLVQLASFVPVASRAPRLGSSLNKHPTSRQLRATHPPLVEFVHPLFPVCVGRPTVPHLVAYPVNDCMTLSHPTCRQQHHRYPTAVQSQQEQQSVESAQLADRPAVVERDPTSYASTAAHWRRRQQLQARPARLDAVHQSITAQPLEPFAQKTQHHV